MSDDTRRHHVLERTVDVPLLVHLLHRYELLLTAIQVAGALPGFLVVS